MRAPAAALLLLCLGCNPYGLGGTGAPPVAGNAPDHSGGEPGQLIPFACEQTCSRLKACAEPSAKSCHDACKARARPTRGCANEYEVWAHVRDACLEVQCLPDARPVTTCVDLHMRAWCQSG